MKVKTLLTIQFIPHYSLESLSSLGRIRKLLKMARENKIVLLEGRLKKEEEAELIKTTMEEIDDEFKGIELAVIYPEADQSAAFLKKMKSRVINALLGKRLGFTIIGPASIVKEIRKDPHKIQLLTDEKRKAVRRR